jgi:hypothetical protein
LNVNPNAYSSAFIPPHQPSDSVDQASSKTASVLSRGKRGVATQDGLWPQHSTLKISMAGMTEEQKKFTRDNINKWAPHVNLKFDFTDKPGGDIRIEGGDGNWSGLGTESKRQDADKPTMLINFKNGMNTGSAATILHEFGHALGLYHEHQHPENTLDLNMSQIYPALASQSDREGVDYNMKKITEGVVSAPYDQKSIMHYGFAANWLNDGKAIERNSELSKGDISFVRSLYPPKIRKPASSPWWDYRGLYKRS